MIVVTTPTGNIGHQVLERIVSGNESVRVIAGDPSRLPQDLLPQVEVIQGSHSDPMVINQALTGADALFWLVPPEPLMKLENVDDAYVHFTEAAAEAIRDRGVKRIVAVSALGRGWANGGLATANLKAMRRLSVSRF